MKLCPQTTVSAHSCQHLAPFFFPLICAIKETLGVLDRLAVGSVVKHELSYKGLDLYQL